MTLGLWGSERRRRGALCRAVPHCVCRRAHVCPTVASELVGGFRCWNWRGRTEVCGQQKQSNDPGNNQHILNAPTTGRR